MDEKEIIKKIKNNNFSELDFLYDKESLNSNKKHYGFLYFLEDKKRKPTQVIFNKIKEIIGNLSESYEYLGNIASEIYSEFGEESISLGFFRKSVFHDKFNSNAWWNIYAKSYDDKAFLKAIEVDYHKKDFKKLNIRLYNYNFYSIHDLKLSNSENRKLLEILEDPEVIEKNENILASVYFSLQMYEQGLKTINLSKKINHQILKKYLRKNLISIDKAILKSSIFSLESEIKNNPKKIYLEFKKEAKKGKTNPTKALLISKAFRAKEFKDVIKIYNQYKKEKNISIFSIDLEAHIFYIISQIKTNKKPNKDTIEQIKSVSSTFQDRNKGLIEAFKFILNFQNLNKRFSNGDWKHCQIYHIAGYSDIEESIDNPDFIKHFLYKESTRELEALKKKWNLKHFKEKLNQMLKSKSTDPLSHEDMIEVCNLLMHTRNYKQVTNRLKEYHETNKGTLSTHNLLGVCFERQCLYNKAFNEYKNALNIMLSAQDYDYYVISNYLSCAKKISVEIEDKESHSLRELLNNSLVESFQWHTFTAERRQTLYKYFPFNVNTLDSIINKYFYFPSKNQLNDPIEMPSLKNIGSDSFIDSDFKICSFTNNENSMLMWSHYTNNHQGIMIEYSFGRELPSGLGIEKVQYRNKSKRFIDKNKYIFNQFLLTKNDEWSYEKEVRLISYKKNKIQYEKYEYPDPDKEKLNVKIESITLGCNFDSSKKDMIINIIKNINKNKNPLDKNITLKEAYISNKNPFILEYKLIKI